MEERDSEQDSDKEAPANSPLLCQSICKKEKNNSYSGASSETSQLSLQISKLNVFSYLLLEIPPTAKQLYQGCANKQTLLFTTILLLSLLRMEANLPVIEPVKKLIHSTFQRRVHLQVWIENKLPLLGNRATQIPILKFRADLMKMDNSKLSAKM